MAEAHSWGRPADRQRRLHMRGACEVGHGDVRTPIEPHRSRSQDGSRPVQLRPFLPNPPYARWSLSSPVDVHSRFHSTIETELLLGTLPYHLISSLSLTLLELVLIVRGGASSCALKTTEYAHSLRLCCLSFHFGDTRRFQFRQHSDVVCRRDERGCPSGV